MLACNLAKEHHWDNWCGSYEDVLPYLRVAFEAVIEELHSAAEPQVRDEIAQLVAYLCELDPLKRGHPLNLAGRGSEYGVERFESRFDYMASREELSLRRLIA